MPNEVCTSLAETLASHFTLSKSRLMTLAYLIVGMVNGRTVNLSHVASTLPGEARISSHYRRLQRFFQYVELDQERVALIVVRMLNLARPKCLALDRTNWKVGTKDINILVLAIVTRRFRVPLLWTLLDHSGSSHTNQRVALIERYLALLGAGSIKLLLADREFIGARWMEFLRKNAIPFAIRMKSEQHLVFAQGQKLRLATVLRRVKARRSIWQCRATLPGTGLPIACAAKQLKTGEWLIIATNTDNPRQALQAYAKRWSIECLFADTKTRGFNFEDTRLTDKAKISTLLAIVTLAITWAYRCASTLLVMKAVKRKTHGRREKSWFRIGLDILRNWIFNASHKATTAWISTAPKRLKNI